MMDAPQLRPSVEPLPVLDPPTSRMMLRVCVMGLRGLRPAGLKDPIAILQSPARPFVELDAGSFHSSGKVWSRARCRGGLVAGVR